VGSIKQEDQELVISRIIRSKRRTIGLQITDDGQLIVRAPWKADEATIREVVIRHRKWIERTRQKIKIQREQTPPRVFKDGEQFLYLGKYYPLQLVKHQETPLRFAEGFFIAHSFLPEAALLFFDWYWNQARKIIIERVQYFAAQHHFTYRQVKISNARTRWGSCSAKGNLNFTWRLIMAPLPVIDYVVVHELVHLKIKNHSRQFWNRVEELMPDYRQHKKWLKENGHRLRI